MTDAEVPEVEEEDLFESTDQSQSNQEVNQPLPIQPLPPKKKSRYVKKGLSEEGKKKRQENAKKAREAKLKKSQERKQQQAITTFEVEEDDEPEDDEADQWILQQLKTKKAPIIKPKPTPQPQPQVGEGQDRLDRIEQMMMMMMKKQRKATPKERKTTVVQVMPQPIAPVEKPKPQSEPVNLYGFKF